MPATIIDSAIFQGIFASDEMRHVWSDENRTQPQGSQADADVRGAAAAAYLQVVDQERDRQLVQLLHDQRVGEPAGERHQVVGGDGAGDEQ